MKGRFFFTIIMVILLFLWIGCSKNAKESARIFPRVKIDSIKLFDFDDISISASFENAGVDPIIKKGFCWSKTQNPDINDNRIDLSASAPFSDTIYDAGQSTTIYFRAYVQTTDSIYYSNDASIATEGLYLSFQNDLNDGSIRRIRQVIETPDNQFLQLVQVISTGISWPQIVKLDRAGSVIWKQSYNVGENKHPDQIIKVADGYLFVATSFMNQIRGLSLTKIDFNGYKKWERVFTQKNNQEFIRIVLLPNSTVKLTMFSFDAIVSSAKTACVINESIVDLSGNLASEKIIAVDNRTTLETYAWLGTNITTEEFLLSGHYSDRSMIFDELAVQKFNSSNQLDWERRYKTGKVKGPAAVVVSPEGNYDILALVEQSGKENAWLMEIDKNNGNKQWEFIYDANTYGSTISTFGTKLFLDTFGNYFVFGKINDAANPAVNLFVLKLSSRGEKLWSHLFRYPKGQSSHADDILKIGKDIYLFGTILDDQVVGSNSIFMMKLAEN